MNWPWTRRRRLCAQMERVLERLGTAEPIDDIISLTDCRSLDEGWEVAGDLLRQGRVKFVTKKRIALSHAAAEVQALERMYGGEG